MKVRINLLFFIFWFFSPLAMANNNSLILFIGDGMGTPQVALTRLYAANLEPSQKLTLDEILVGLVNTQSIHDELTGQSGRVTDSAAAATALSTGKRTPNAKIGVDANDKPIQTIIQSAKAAGKSTGIITTTSITHATPASFATHVPHRKMETEIAAQLVNSGVDVLMGGGERYFIAEPKDAKFGEAVRTDNKNLLKQFKSQGYSIAFTVDELKAAKQKPVLGLFAADQTAFELARAQSAPSLVDMLEKSLELLGDNPKGFLLIVEGGRIDHAAHANNPVDMVHETLMFDKAVRTGLEYVKANPNSALMVTADHETGGLTLGRSEVYDVNVEALMAVNASSETIQAAIKSAKNPSNVKKVLEQYTSIDDFTQEELTLLAAGGLRWDKLISDRAFIGWTTHGHTGLDVGIYAYGDVAGNVSGYIDNTDIPVEAERYLGLN